MPSTRRPPDRWFTVAACFASSAALPRVTSGSVLPYTRRSITPSVEKPRSSAAMAHSTICEPLVPGMVEGRPMPMSMRPGFPFCPVRQSSFRPGARPPRAALPGRLGVWPADMYLLRRGCRTWLGRVAGRQVGDFGQPEVDARDDRVEILPVLADLSGVVELEDAHERVSISPAAPQQAVGLEPDDDGVVIRPKLLDREAQRVEQSRGVLPAVVDGGLAREPPREHLGPERIELFGVVGPQLDPGIDVLLLEEAEEGAHRRDVATTSRAEVGVVLGRGHRCAPSRRSGQRGSGPMTQCSRVTMSWM